MQRLGTSFAYLSDAIENKDLDQFVEAVKRWLDEPTNDRWIVIYDNFDNPLFGSDITRRGLVYAVGSNPKTEDEDEKDGANSKAFDIRPYLPNTDHGPVIVTTRSSTFQFGTCIKLGTLKVNDSLEILALTFSRKSLKKGKKIFIITYHQSLKQKRPSLY